MPELPEVETIVRGLAPRLVGRRIERIEVFQPRVWRGEAGRARGFTVTGVQRRGKHILLELRRGSARACLGVHLGMTGQLLWKTPPGRHTRAVLHLHGGDRVLYNDIRQFGRLELAADLPERVARLGPDALRIQQREFLQRFTARRGMIKPLLLDQAFLSGLGNIYADEALFRARVHPRATAAALPPARAAGLFRAMRRVLAQAIAQGGSSISDYVGSDGRPGRFQLRHNVYGRTGEPCRVCGASIRRIVVGGRGTHFCPRCQKPPRG